MHNEKDGRQFGVDKGQELGRSVDEPNHELQGEELRLLETLGVTNPKATAAIAHFGRQCFIGGAKMATTNPPAGYSGENDLPRIADDWISARWPTFVGNAERTAYAGRSQDSPRSAPPGA